MALRPCLDCGQLTDKTRCGPCGRLHDTHRRPSFNERYGPEYQHNRLLALERDQRICQIRGPRCTHHATTADHITPREHGGTHNLTNLRAACSTCNSGRR